MSLDGVVYIINGRASILAIKSSRVRFSTNNYIVGNLLSVCSVPSVDINSLPLALSFPWIELSFSYAPAYGVSYLLFQRSDQIVKFFRAGVCIYHKCAGICIRYNSELMLYTIPSCSRMLWNRMELIPLPKRVLNILKASKSSLFLLPGVSSQ